MSTTRTPIVADEAPARNSRRRRRQRIALILLVVSLLGSAAALTLALRALHPPMFWVLVGIGALMVVGVGLRLRYELDSRRDAVALGLAVGTLAAVVGQTVVAPTVADTLARPNKQVAARVLRIDRELRVYARASERAGASVRVPRREDFLTFVRKLEGGPALLENPFGGPPQANAVAPGAELVTAAQLAAHEPQLANRTVLGPGFAPRAGAYRSLTYGALVYDCDPKSGVYVLYGIGQQGDDALLVHQVTGP